MKAPALAEDETARIEELRRYDILDTGPEQEFDDLTLLASHICGTPLALISLVDRDRQWFKSRVGIQRTETARDVSFCGHAILQRDVFVVPDAALDARFADNPLVTEDPNFRFYAGAPLVTRDGQALGTLCVMDRRPRTLTTDQIDALGALSRQVVAQLELRQRLLREREESREALREKEKTLQMAVGEMPVVLWSTDLDLKLTTSTGGGLAGMEKTPGQFVGLRLSEFFQTTDPEFLPLIAHRKALLGESVRFEVDWAGKTFASHVEPLRNPDGTIRGVAGIALDITPQKRAEEELKHSLSLMKATLDSTADGILVVDADGRIVSGNRRFYEMWRVPDEIAGGSDPNALLAWLLEQIEDPGTFLRKVTRVARLPDPEPAGVLELKDGRVFERTSHPQRSGDQTVGRVWSFRDITEQMDLEEELEGSLALLKATLDATADGVLVVDREGKILRFNRRFVEMWRIPDSIVESRDDGQALNFVLDQLKDPARFLKKVRDLYDQPDSQSYDWLEFKDGRVFERYSAPHRVSGKVIGRVWSFRDVSDRCRMEEILRRHTRTFEHIFDGVIVMDLSGKVVDCNRAAEEMLGTTRQEMLGRLPVISEGQDSEVRTAQMIAEMRKRGRWAGETRCRRKDGSEAICETVVIALWDDYGRIVAALQVNRDITELRRLQEAARATTEG